jgi:hypothetical protein
MSPRQHDVFQSTVWLVNSTLGAVYGIFGVWVGLERVGIDVLIGKFAPDDECITYDIPLALRSKHGQEFAKIVYKTCDLHPLWLPIPANGFRCLKQVFDL